MDKIKGCLFGGAIGDALGYFVEFDREEDIFKCYGKQGITEYQGMGLISDDTQMTLFTAVALTRGNDYVSQINQCYLDWLNTQRTDKYKSKTSYCWLYNVDQLHHRRAPGGTCLDALMRGGNGTFENPINDSKGCGGIMRVAPIGLVCKEEALLLGAKAAALTHGHSLGYMSSGMLSELIRLIMDCENIDLEILVKQSLENTEKVFSKDPFFKDMKVLVEKAIDLSKKEIPDLEAIHQLGEGWIAEETLAIAVYCSLKYKTDFKSAIIAAVNHNGDSDSTGAVTGNILGAYLGYEALPQEYLDDLELKDIIEKVAGELKHELV